MKRAILLMNLGSPDSTSVRDVHTYLMEFLMDKRVIDYPWLFRKILVGGLIVPARAKKSADTLVLIPARLASTRLPGKPLGIQVQRHFPRRSSWTQFR